jgi:ABC-type antimicrobial peptide transport system permease subunit
MFRNYFKIAWRNLWKNKLFSLINVISLAIGLSASFVIGMMVYYDFTFDKFHPDSDRIYRITTNFVAPEGETFNRGVPAPLGTKMREGMTGVETASFFFTYSPAKVKSSITGRTYERPTFTVFADHNYFDLFHYTWLAGNPRNALLNPNEVVLTEERAKKYFPDLNPQEIVGATLIYNDSINTTVTGIVKNFEKRSDLIFEEFISLQTAAQTDMKDQAINDQWGSTNSASQLFIKISENVTVDRVQKRLDALSKEHESEDAQKFGRTREFYLEPLQDLHFSTDYGISNFGQQPANKATLIGLACIAIFLLLLGCINFINLNTAQATQRAKEIGIRKTLGGSKKQLVFQFLGETFLLTFLATILSIILAFWLLKVFADFIPPGVNFELFANPTIWIFIVALLLIVTLLSGFYPAMVLSHYKPVSVLKNQVVPGKHTSSMRKSLTVFQFVIAQVFIIATILVGKQIQFLMTKDMGFKTEAIAYVSTPWGDQSMDKRIRFMEEIKSLPQIKDVSLGGSPPASLNTTSTTTSYFDDENKEININLQLLYGDANFMDLYEIQLLAGRSLRNDTVREYVINETYLNMLGFTNPQDAIGKFLFPGDDSYPIVGVMENFNQRSLKSGIEPMALVGDWYRTSYSQFNTIHFSMATGDTGNWSPIVSTAEDSWKNIYPDADFQLNFIDETIADFYKRERSIATLLNWATGLSVLISCLGLFGLVIYTTARRTKEIGIRKILGASLVQLNLLLCKDFMKLVALAFLIAAPIAWWGLQNWLQDFAFKTELSWWVFFFSGLAMLFIALIIMSIRTLSTAMKNPVKSLRTD